MPASPRSAEQSAGAGIRSHGARADDTAKSRRPLHAVVMQHFATGSLMDRVLYPYFSRSSRPLRRTMFL